MQFKSGNSGPPLPGWPFPLRGIKARLPTAHPRATVLPASLGDKWREWASLCNEVGRAAVGAGEIREPSVPGQLQPQSLGRLGWGSLRRPRLPPWGGVDLEWGHGFPHPFRWGSSTPISTVWNGVPGAPPHHHYYNKLQDCSHRASGFRNAACNYLASKCSW